MERAIHITELKNLGYFQKGRYQRIYWGVEFCQNLIPSTQDTDKVLRFVKRNNLGFTLVTPLVTERGLKKITKILFLLKRKRINCEVVINDWGILGWLNENFNDYFELALGRLLGRQQRYPEITKTLEKQSPFAVKSDSGNLVIYIHRLPDKRYRRGIKSSYINSPLAQQFLSKLGIKRVEFNNLIQGIDLTGIKFKKSIYTPFINISTTRFCPMDKKYQELYRINVCHKECQNYYDRLSMSWSPVLRYKKGNTVFYRNPVDENRAAAMGIDRIVFQPELPF